MRQMKLRWDLVPILATIAVTLTACGSVAESATAPARTATAATPLATPGDSTPPPSSPSDPTRTVTFTALGDIGASADASDVLTELGQAAADLTVVVGDLSYGKVGAEEKWCAFVKERVGADHPFELLSGNHESDGKNGNINDFSACLPNQLPGLVGTYGRQYYVDVPHEQPLVRFVMISPGLHFPQGRLDYDRGGESYTWTEEAIDSARAAGIPWVVVGAHKPCLSIGQYGCDSGSDIFALLLAKRVDLVLHGHEHIYQRTVQLTAGTPGCPALVPGRYNRSCVTDSDGVFTKGAGTIAATVGSGGRTLRSLGLEDPEARYFAAASGRNQEPTFGFLQVSATEDRLSAEFVGVNGRFEDEFTISR